MNFSQNCYLTYCLEYIICTEYLQLFKAINLLTNKHMRIVSVQTYFWYLVFCFLDTTELTAPVQMQMQQYRESTQLCVKLRNLWHTNITVLSLIRGKSWHNILCIVNDITWTLNIKTEVSTQLCDYKVWTVWC